MYFFAEDRELAWLTLAAGCPDSRLCLWKWLEVSLHSVVNQQNMENFDKQMLEQSDRTLFHRNRVHTVNIETGRGPEGSKLSFTHTRSKMPKASEELGISDLG